MVSVYVRSTSLTIIYATLSLLSATIGLLGNSAVLFLAGQFFSSFFGSLDFILLQNYANSIEKVALIDRFFE